MPGQRMRPPRKVIPQTGLEAAVGFGVDGDNENPSEWQQGAVLDPQFCGGADINTVCGDDHVVQNLVQMPAVEIHPVLLGTRIQCSLFDLLGYWERAQEAGLGVSTDGISGNASIDAKRMMAAYNTWATHVLEACRWSKLAGEIWTGQRNRDAIVANPLVKLNRSLANDQNPIHPVVNAGLETGVAADSIFEMDAAIAWCESYGRSATCFGDVVIHMTMEAATAAVSRGLIVPLGSGRHETVAGRIAVIADRGYDGSGPLSLGSPAATPQDSWMYVTTTLKVSWGGMDGLFTDPNQAVSMGTNDFATEVGISAAYSWACGHGAIRVNNRPVQGVAIV